MKRLGTSLVVFLLVIGLPMNACAGWEFLKVLRFWNQHSLSGFRIVNSSGGDIAVYMGLDCEVLYQTGHGCQEKLVIGKLAHGDSVAISLNDVPGYDKDTYDKLREFGITGIRIGITVVSEERQLQSWLSCVIATDSRRKADTFRVTTELAIE